MMLCLVYEKVFVVSASYFIFFKIRFKKAFLGFELNDVVAVLVLYVKQGDYIVCMAGVANLFYFRLFSVLNLLKSY